MRARQTIQTEQFASFLESIDFSLLVFGRGYATVPQFNDDGKIYMGLSQRQDVPFTPESWNDLGQELMAIIAGKSWIFGDLYRLGELNGLDPEQLAPIGAWKTIRNWASTASSYPLIAPPEMAQFSTISQYLDKVACKGETRANGQPLGLMRFAQLPESHHTAMNKLGNGMSDYRAMLILQAIHENWTAKDCRKRANEVISELATKGNTDAQNHFQVKKVFQGFDTSGFGFQIKPGMTKQEVYKAILPLVNKIMALPADASECSIEGKISWIKG
jgi:hypothetical protein